MELTFIKNKQVVALLIVALITALSILYTSVSQGKEQAIAQLIAAIIENDTVALQEILTSEDKYFKINESNIVRFTQYITEQDILADIETKLKAGEEHRVVSINKDTKWFFFHTYNFAVKPYYVKIQFPKEVTEIEINGTSYLVKGEDELTKTIPLIPGSYNARFKFETEYVTFTEENEFILDSNKVDSDRVYTLNTANRDRKAEIYANWSNVKVFVNGKEIGVTDARTRKTILNPVPYDGSVKVTIKKEFPWGTFASDELAITKRKQPLLIDAESMEVTNDIIRSLEMFLHSYQPAFNEKNAELLTNVTSSARKSFAKEFATMFKSKRDYVMTNSNSTYISLKAATANHVIFEQFGKYSVRAETQQIFDVAGDVYNEERVFLMTYNKERKQWLVDISPTGN
jgi:uncharacterized membrane protein YvbJ